VRLGVQQFGLSVARLWCFGTNRDKESKGLGRSPASTDSNRPPEEERHPFSQIELLHGGSGTDEPISTFVYILKKVTTGDVRDRQIHESSGGLQTEIGTV
jgi:hypothetical protein